MGLVSFGTMGQVGLEMKPNTEPGTKYIHAAWILSILYMCVWESRGRAEQQQADL